MKYLVKFYLLLSVLSATFAFDFNNKEIKSKHGKRSLAHDEWHCKLHFKVKQKTFVSEFEKF